MARTQLQNRRILFWCYIAIGALLFIGMIRIDLFTNIQPRLQETQSLSINNTKLLQDKEKLEQEVKLLKHELENRQSIHHLRKKIIHVLGTGCVGSTYSAITLSQHPDIFKIPQEPFNTHLHLTYRKPLYIPLLQCLFLKTCDNDLVKIRLHLRNKADIEQFKQSPILLKTTQFQRFDLLNEILGKNTNSRDARNVIDQYYIVLLIRDPRATWNSCKQHPIWNESDPTFLCDNFMKMIDALEALRNDYRLNIIGMYSEYIATLYPYQYRDIIYKFVGLSRNITIQKDRKIIKEQNKKFGNKKKKIQHANRWLNDLDISQIHMIQNIDSCRKWMDKFGYNLVKESKENILLNKLELTNSRNPYPINL